MELTHTITENLDYPKPFALALTKDSENARDLLQETIYHALANQEKYNTGKNLKAWLYPIMRIIFINNYRKQSRQQDLVIASGNKYSLERIQPAALNKAQGKLVSKGLQTALYNLPVVFKTPFMLYFEGYRYHEIADLMKEPQGTIKCRIHFARKLLKQEILKN